MLELELFSGDCGAGVGSEAVFLYSETRKIVR
jgi:hypothetical protein